jgi:GNAT superfamily N-acetyltransferase
VNRQAYFARVDATWARHYGVSVDCLAQVGTTSILEDYDGLLVVLYAIGSHRFAQTSAELLPYIQQVVNDRPRQALTGADFLSAWSVEPAAYVPGSYVFHLYPPDFRRVKHDALIRELTAADAPALAKVKQAVPAGELEEADVELSHDDVCGAWLDDQLAAVGSTYDFRGFVDPGVVTHPAYRQRGLGTAVIAHIVQRVLARDELMLYRCAAENIGSYKIAQTLGFTRCVTVTGFRLDRLPA